MENQVIENIMTRTSVRKFSDKTVSDNDINTMLKAGIAAPSAGFTKCGMDFKTEQNRIYAEDPTGKVIAEITFPVKDGIATIDHTFVDESLRGQGIAGKLMEAAVKKIQADGNKIAATCSYAVAWLGKHQEVPHVDTGAPIACKVGGRH